MGGKYRVNQIGEGFDHVLLNGWVGGWVGGKGRMGRSGVGCLTTFLMSGRKRAASSTRRVPLAAVGLVDRTHSNR